MLVDVGGRVVIPRAGQAGCRTMGWDVVRRLLVNGVFGRLICRRGPWEFMLPAPSYHSD